MFDERIVENNIFSFATNELSQDAFICWCLNWINMPVRDDNASGRQFGARFLSRLLHEAYDVSKVNQVYIFRQLLNIDVLVLVPELQVALIIEDKTSSQEHGNQINRYKYLLSKTFESNQYSGLDIYQHLSDDNKGKQQKCDETACWGAVNSIRWALRDEPGKLDLSKYTIHTTYLKTDWFNDDDWHTVQELEKEPKVNTYVDGPEFLSLLLSCREWNNPILMSFVDYLSSKIKTTIEHSCFWEHYKDIDEHIRFYIQDTAIAQRRFLQTVFNQPNHESPFMAELKQHVEDIEDSYVYGRIDDAPNTHTIQHGSSFGTPWSLMHFWGRSLDRTVDADYWGFQNTNEDNLTVKPYMFWRVDKIKEGPVLSLRYYTWWEKGAGDNGESNTCSYKTRVYNYIKEHKLSLEKISAKLEAINELYCCTADKGDICSEGNLYKQYENTLLQFKLHNILIDWNDEDKRTKFISLMRELNEELTQEIENVEWELVRKGELK
ncbi:MULTISPECIES: PD-(D/E)XK nuclease family protein [Veillonella]|uniref:PD-(D/E)XK nuclease family protein n=1 Tax=Veillonella TaxID=29465 RepID=UPI001D05DAA8|nr:MULTISPECIES: PD-(D/E)XK nuclease family protein [Veillonella]MBS6122333.1 PD-(D/E)XK nuclease family protein [Veillonella sp.]MCB6515632.1 PD-(D/E)XK nuclease family protein [Veillonella atypica]MCG4863232.1 PD-(D/E)XK nuclease family protein [Veillonella atypica]